MEILVHNSSSDTLKGATKITPMNVGEYEQERKDRAELFQVGRFEETQTTQTTTSGVVQDLRAGAFRTRKR